MFRFLEIGRFQPDQIFLRWVESTWKADPRAREIIESTWRQAIGRPNVKLFDGAMCRLESMRQDAGGLHLDLSPTSYKIFYGTNLLHPELADELGDDVMGRAVGVSVGLLSADGHFLFGRRNSSVAYYPNRVHPFAGTLEPRDVPDAFAAARRELHEELNLRADEIVKIECLGVAEDVALRQPEMIFFARLNLSRFEVERRVVTDEHRSLYAFRAEENAVRGVLKNEASLTPIARATLDRCGEVYFADRD